MIEKPENLTAATRLDRASSRSIQWLQSMRANMGKFAVITFDYEFSRVADFWVAEHRAGHDSSLVFLVAGRWHEISDARRFPNRAWQNEIARLVRGGARIKMRVTMHGPFDTLEAAQGLAAGLSVVSRPAFASINTPTERPRNTGPRPVVCKGTMQLFPSIGAAAKSVGADVGNMSKHLEKRNGFRSVKGQEFCFLADLPESDQNFVIRQNEGQLISTRAINRNRAIINLSTMTVFHTVGRVCEVFHISKRDVREIVETTHNHNGAFLWYIDEVRKSILPDWLKEYGKDDALFED